MGSNKKILNGAVLSTTILRLFIDSDSTACSTLLSRGRPRFQSQVLQIDRQAITPFKRCTVESYLTNPLSLLFFDKSLKERAATKPTVRIADRIVSAELEVA